MTDEQGTPRTLELKTPVEAGPWQLEVGAADGSMAAAELGRGRALTLGSGGSADLRLVDPTVSGLHCRLQADERGLEVLDLGSKNGLFVGGARVPRARLDPASASFVIGRSTVTVRSGSPASSASRTALPGMVGRSEPMCRVAEEVRRHAPTRAPILIQGESGTGKDLVARALHSLGRPEGPYLPLNVGAIAETLADSELFGHRRGAFTGAVSHRQGAFELAHQGTLFLDEVAELSPGVQVRLLRVVEDGTVRPLGAHASTRVDVRIVSASWVALPERVEQGRFRADLYHRLSTVTLKLPPLRERRSDIPALSTLLLAQLDAELGRKLLSADALSMLVAHDWPGNVRELASVLYRAAALAPGREISGCHLALSVHRAGPRGVRAGSGSSISAEGQLRPLAGLDAKALLQSHSGNVSAAARAARMPRTTFRALLLKDELSTRTCR